MSILQKGALVALAIFAAGPASAATEFDFTFGSGGLTAPDGVITPPVVGTGTFISPVDLTPGKYNLTALPGFQLAFQIGGVSFGNADILTPISGVAVNILPFAPQERLEFTESGSTGSNGGPNHGALDLASGLTGLTFEPSFFGGNYLYQSGEFAGVYLALSAVPEPASLLLLTSGVMLAVSRRRRG